MKKIAVDAMGGDFAPQSVVEGVEKARNKYPDLRFMLFGDEQKIRKILTSDKNIEIIQTTEVIDMNDEPVKAIRRKKDSSLVRAAYAVKEGKADALLSLGNTGALLACGIFIIGRIKGIIRYLDVRRSKANGEIMVILVSRVKDFPTNDGCCS